jgi:hypothetical protein
MHSLLPNTINLAVILLEDAAGNVSRLRMQNNSGHSFKTMALHSCKLQELANAKTGLFHEFCSANVFKTVECF